MIAILFASLSLAVAAEPPRPSEPFRAEHAVLERELDHIDARVGKLATLEGDARAREMGEIVSFFREHIGPHAAWEERVLYPAVDRRVPTGEAEPFTASMRHDHTVVERWIGELDGMARSPAPDARAFTRRADNLLGLVRAHFEAEEDVLLPVLDRSMTPEQFREEILDGNPDRD